MLFPVPSKILISLGKLGGYTNTIPVSWKIAGFTWLLNKGKSVAVALICDFTYGMVTLLAFVTFKKVVWGGLCT